MAHKAVLKPLIRKGAYTDVPDELTDESFSGRQFITALARGLDVLGAFCIGDPPLSNQELAKRCQLPRPTISRITRTLTELGYLSYHEGFGCYELGGAMLSLGHVARNSFQALEDAIPVMNELANFSNANVGIGMRDRLSMVYLVVREAPSGIGLRFGTGSKVPIIHTAMGLAYLAGIERKILQGLESRLLKKYANESIKVKGVIAAAREEYEAQGFCSSTGGWHPEVNGIATPIPWPAVADMLVLNCGAPASLMSKERMLGEIGPRLIETAREIGKLLTATDVTKVY
ncbi:MAG: IclR family transcriptional regulator [Alphaproteobacteria bacterium]|nr:IclR family transcriptional regulator [Alphaproteobacteria bacterium]